MLLLPSFAAEHGRLQQIMIDNWYAAQHLSIEICCDRPRSAANQPHAAAADD